MRGSQSGNGEERQTAYLRERKNVEGGKRPGKEKREEKMVLFISERREKWHSRGREEGKRPRYFHVVK